LGRATKCASERYAFQSGLLVGLCGLTEKRHQIPKDIYKYTGAKTEEVYYQHLKKFRKTENQRLPDLTRKQK